MMSGAQEVADAADDAGISEQVVDLGVLQMRRADGVAAQAGGHHFFQLLVEEGPVPSYFVGVEHRDSRQIAVAVEGRDLLGSEGRGGFDAAGMEAEVAVHRPQRVLAGIAFVGVGDLAWHVSVSRVSPGQVQG